MWLNMIFLAVASMCVGFVLGWLVARPRRWGVFAGGRPARDAVHDGRGPLTGDPDRGA